MGVSLSVEVLREYEIPKLVELLENVEKLYNETSHDSVLEETNRDFALTYNLVEEVLIEKGYYNILKPLPVGEATPLINQWQEDEGRWDSVCLDCGRHWASNIKICRECTKYRALTRNR